MKICPDCGTQYEDHVASCLVDGSDLSAVASVPASMGPSSAPSSTPRGAPIVAPAPPPRRGGGGTVMLAMAGVLALLALLVVVAIMVVVFSSNSKPAPLPPEPAPQARPLPVPEPVAMPVPVPEVQPDLPTITLNSNPEGAEVWEGQTKLCETPCTTAHPEHAPLPREFVLKMKGYVDTTYSMEVPDQEHMVSMRRPAVSPKPTPGPRVPQISIER